MEQLRKTLASKSKPDQHSSMIEYPEERKETSKVDEEFTDDDLTFLSKNKQEVLKILKQGGGSINKNKFGMSAGSKRKKDRKIAAKIQSVTFPKMISQTAHNKRKYEVTVHYLDNERKSRQKKVKFGRHDKASFLDHHNNVQRLIEVNHLRDCANPLYPNFWNSNFLNHYSGDSTKAFGEICQTLDINKI